MRQLTARQLTAIALGTICSGLAQSGAAEPDAPDYREPIIVTGYRLSNPSLSGVQPVDELGPRDFSDFAVNSIEELLTELNAQMAAGGDGAPLVLLNGRRIFNLSELASLPTESVRRVDVLPAPVALRFGGNASQKVVNLVLRSRFRSASAAAGGRIATEGGGRNADLSGSLSRVVGENRLSLSARAYGGPHVLESERDIVQPAGARSGEGRFRTLLPAQRRYTLNGTLARQVSKTANLSATAGGNYETTRRLLGRPNEFTGIGSLDKPLRNKVRNFGSFVSLKGNADLKHWSLAGTAEYGRRTTSTLTELRAQALAPLSQGLGASRLTDRARARTHSAGLTFLASGPLFKVPAGRVRASLYTDLDRSSLLSRRTQGGAVRSGERGRTDAGTWLSAEAPITKSKSGGMLGGLEANFRAGLRSVSDIGTLRSYSYGLAWAPRRVVNLNASMKKDRQPPTLIQLASPAIETSGIRVFDYVRGETVELTEITGGNPDLDADRRRTFAVGVNVGPLAGKLRIGADYKRVRIGHPTAALPAATAAIQAAFPERFIRDSNGALISVDSRAVNFDRQDLKQLHWGAVWRYSADWGVGHTSSELADDVSGNDEASRSGLRLHFSVDHTLMLKDRLLLRRDLPPLDLLHGGAAGPYGGEPRHRLRWEAGASRAGIGARIIGTWRSGTTVDENGPVSSLQFSPLMQNELRLNAELDSVVPRLEWARGARLSLSVANLFNEKQKVRDASGRTPLIYQRDYLDPLGRTVTVSLRKLLVGPGTQSSHSETGLR
jgi:hypothetical protein